MEREVQNIKNLWIWNMHTLISGHDAQVLEDVKFDFEEKFPYLEWEEK